MSTVTGRGRTRTRRHVGGLAARTAVAWAVAAGLAGPAGAADRPPAFTDWKTSASNTATGTLGETPVTFSGSVVGGTNVGTVLDDTSTAFAGSAFSPALPKSDLIRFGGSSGAAYTLNLGRPTADPVLHLSGLASALTFPGGTSIAKVSGDAGLTVSGNVVTGTLNGSSSPIAAGADASGTVRLSGTFSTVTFTAVPVFSGSPAGDAIDLQVGAPLPEGIGDLDPDFNGGRPVLVNPAGATFTWFTGVLVDGSRRVVAAGAAQHSSAATTGLLTRLGPDGRLDAGFGGGDGVVEPQYDVAGTPTTIAHGLTQDPGGRLGAGWSISSPTTFLAGRYADTGAEDAAFGTDGLGTVGPSVLTGNGAALRDTLTGADGSTLLIGDNDLPSGHPGQTPEITLVRLTPAGDLDTGFGTGGRTTALGSYASDAIRDASGRILVVGTALDERGDRAATVTRFTPDGAVDTTFGNAGTGRAIVQVGILDSSGGGSPHTYSYGNGIALAPDGRIWVAAEASDGGQLGIGKAKAAVIKLTADGVLDQSFGGRQVPNAIMGTGADPLAVGRAISVQGDGKVIVAATYSDSTHNGSRLALARFLPTGPVDTTFGGDGGIVKTIDSGLTIPYALAQTTTGRLIVVGASQKPNQDVQGFIARYVVRDASSIRPPELRHEPGLTGTPRPGSTLTCTPAQWANAPTSTNVVWERAPRSVTSAEDPAWAVVGGTTGTTYTVVDQDLGSRVRCREVATNGDGSDSAPSPSKRVDVGPPSVLQAPTQSGIPVVGQVLTCAVGQWDNGPDLSVRWLRGDAPIDGANNRGYVVREDDRRHQVSCEVTATNDIATAAPARSNTQLAVGAPPRSEQLPVATLTRTGNRATDVRLTCAPGTWDEDYGAYDYRWERGGAEIAGATGQTYDATVDDLGALVACVVHSTNPAGRSEPARGDGVLVPLPSSGEPGAIYRAGGFNRLDPVNMMAVSGGFLRVVKDLVVARRVAATQTALQDCRRTDPNAPLPSFAKYVEPGPGYYVSGKSMCGILLRAPASQVLQVTGGTYWRAGYCKLPGETGGTSCPKLGVRVEPLNAATPPASLTPMEQARLQDARPLRVLWDFDRNGRTDAECSPDAPILRSLYSRGNYTVRAVIVSADSQETGLYSVTDLPIDFFSTSSSQRGALRAGQPFACKTSLEPPPEPSRPCVTEVAIGRTHVTGNLCPISARRIPAAELAGLPLNVQRMLEAQALNGPLRRSVPAQRPEPTALGAIRAVPGSLAYDATAQISALSTIDGATEAKIPKAWEDKLKDVKSFDLANGQFAMDQIYIAKGTAKLNGITMDPVGAASTVLVPSDAGAAIDGIKKMTVSSTNVSTVLGGIPIGSPGKLSADLIDRAGVVPPALRGANLDAIAASLKSKLNLGPFKLAGDAKVRLADDGSAFLDAQAELPALLTGPRSSPIRTSVTIRATREGKVTLQGVHLTAPQAYLGAVKIRDLAMDYDGNGLSLKGQLLFPPVDAGIGINRFRIDDRGRFRELDVDYLAGSGQGIGIGPGLFLTKLGGGLSLDPDEIRARATVSVGPSTGGGCPTAGIDAGFVVHFAPAPFYVDATGTVQLVCIPLGNAHFYADSTGLVDVSANLDLDLGPLYLGAAVRGTLQLPRWQVSARGRGGIRHLFSGEVKAMISNLGVAGCGRVEIFPETPFTDAVTVAGGAGIRFSNGRPPLSYPELLGNMRAFSGCSLTSWSPFGRDARSVPASARSQASTRAGGASSFTLGTPAPKVLALELVGSGGAPKVRLRTPAGKVLDASGFGADLVKTADVSGLTDEEHARTVLFVRGQAGTWTVEPAEGSPAVVDVRHASILPEPRVRASVTGRGPARVLRYRVDAIPGQEVRFVEHSDRGQRPIATVEGGGTGTARFTTSEGKGTRRTVVAEVVQDGMPRDSLTVARFVAPSPAAGRPRVRVRRRGASATVTWGAAAYAARYEVVVQTGSGRRLLLTPKGKGRTVRFGGLRTGEGATVRVVALTTGGRRGRAGTARLRGALRYVSVKPKARPKLKKTRKTRG